jgi:hypothetical protein
MTPFIGRRQFISLFGRAAAVWPFTAGAQQPTMPVIEFLSPLSETQATLQLVAFRRGLNDEGFRERQNVAMEIQGRAKGVESPQTTMQGGK